MTFAICDYAANKHIAPQTRHPLPAPRAYAKQSRLRAAAIAKEAHFDAKRRRDRNIPHLV